MDDLRLEERFPSLPVDALWAAWTTPEGVRSFWAPQAEIDPVVGGAYVVAWPGQGWTMRGEVLEIDQPHSLTITWRWDHEKDQPTRHVTLTMAADGSGSRLGIHHRPYAEGDEEQRSSTEDGWRHFAERLRGR